ncbi:MAG: hypothetical protein ACRDYA_22880 [Egibacteraceae bacterium]
MDLQLRPEDRKPRGVEQAAPHSYPGSSTDSSANTARSSRTASYAGYQRLLPASVERRLGSGAIYDAVRADHILVG